MSYNHPPGATVLLDVDFTTGVVKAGLVEPSPEANKAL